MSKMIDMFGREINDGDYVLTPLNSCMMFGKVKYTSSTTLMICIADRETGEVLTEYDDGFKTVSLDSASDISENVAILRFVPPVEQSGIDDLSRKLLSKSVEKNIRSMVLYGTKIKAIKTLREYTRCGLKEAKEIIESIPEHNAWHTNEQESILRDAAIMKTLQKFHENPIRGMK